MSPRPTVSQAKLKRAQKLYQAGLLLRREIAAQVGIPENTLKVYISGWFHSGLLTPRRPGRKPLVHLRRLGPNGALQLEQRAREGLSNRQLSEEVTSHYPPEHLKAPSLSSFLKPRLGYDRRAYRSQAKVLAIELKRQGLGTREAARQAGVPESTLRLWLKKPTSSS